MAALALVVLAATPVRADDAEQAVGLFMQACVRFAGDTAGLRQWATGAGLKPLPPAGQLAFLQRQPGIAFDATNGAGKYVLISGVAGSCSAVAQRAEGSHLAADLERALAQAGVGFGVTADADDPSDKALHHRDYRARKGERVLRIVLSSGTPASGAHPMLSLVPE